MSKYSINQKKEAVSAALNAPSITSVANSLNISISTLHDWVKEDKILSKNHNNLDATEIQRQLINKDNEIKKLKRELEILKKFEAFSAKRLR